MKLLLRSPWPFTRPQRNSFTTLPPRFRNPSATSAIVISDKLKKCDVRTPEAARAKVGNTGFLSPCDAPKLVANMPMIGYDFGNSFGIICGCLGNAGE